MAVTWQNLIENALSEIGVLSPGDAVDSAQLDLALDSMKGMLSVWAENGLLSQIEFDKTVDFSAAGLPFQQTYYLTDNGGTDTNKVYLTTDSYPSIISEIIYHPISHDRGWPLDRDTFDFITSRPGYSPGTIRRYYYGPYYPYGELIFDESPVSGDVIVIKGDAPIIADDALLADSIVGAVPQIMREAIRLNLAIRLASSYRVEPKRATMKGARSTLATIRKRNRKSTKARFDTALLGEKQRHSFRQSYARR